MNFPPTLPHRVEWRVQGTNGGEIALSILKCSPLVTRCCCRHPHHHRQHHYRPLLISLPSLRRKDGVGRTDAKLRFHAPRDEAARGTAVSALATLGDTTIATYRGAFPGQKGSDALTPELLGIKSLPLSSQGTQCAAAGKRQTDSKQSQAGFQLLLLVPVPQKVNFIKLWCSVPRPPPPLI